MLLFVNTDIFQLFFMLFDSIVSTFYRKLDKGMCFQRIQNGANAKSGCVNMAMTGNQ
jgi:hypothetical protein